MGWLLTVGTAAATVATTAALAPAMAASAVSVHGMLGSVLGNGKQSMRALAWRRTGPGVVTSGAALGDGEPLVEVGAGHRRHGRDRAWWYGVQRSRWSVGDELR
jgi:hypothetical protein